MNKRYQIHQRDEIFNIFFHSILMLALIWICATRERACGVATCSFYKLMKQFKIDPHLSCSSLTTCTPGSLLICCAYKKFQNVNGSPTKSIYQADGFRPEALIDGCSLLTQRKRFVDGSYKWLVKIPAVCSVQIGDLP